MPTVPTEGHRVGTAPTGSALPLPLREASWSPQHLITNTHTHTPHAP